MRTLTILALAGGMALAQTKGGEVVDGVTGLPLAGVAVTVMGMRPVVVFTDTAGRFQLPADAGMVRGLRLSRAGYLESMKGGARRMKMSPVAPELPAYVKLSMAPQAVIAGRVVDAEGLPVEGARLSAMRHHVTADGVKLLPSGRPVESDELGRFRIHGLSAGKYFLSAEPSYRLRSWDGRYAAQYRGGTTAPGEKAAIEVKTGQELGDVEFALVRQEGHTVSGKVAAVEGLDGTRMRPSVWLRAAGDAYLSAGVGGGTQLDGSFELRHVPDGKYRLVARTGNSFGGDGEGSYSGSVEIEVAGRDVTDVTVTPRLVKAMTLQGVVTMEDGGAVPAVWMAFNSSTGRAPGQVAVGADGRFTVQGVLPGAYTLYAQPDVRQLGSGMRPMGVRVVSVKAGEREVAGSQVEIGPESEGPLEVKLARMSADVAGRLLDAAGRPATGGVVVLLRGNGTQYFAAQVGETGEFGMAAPAGTYEVLVCPDAARVGEVVADPDYRAVHAKDFQPVVLAAGENTVELRGR